VIELAVMKKYMDAAIEEAEKAVKNGFGGPFGAVVVHKGEIIARGHNRVLETNDPTAHAEMCVIREASQKLKRFDLSDCVIYSTCEPCPMCFAAIHWAKIETLYYGCTRQDAANIGFDDEFIYDVIKGTAKETQVQLEQVFRKECLVPFSAWDAKEDKVFY
jgi:guanine deaminase